jgi:hypothetical protein
MERTFRHSAGFGKRIEFWLIGKMMKEGLDVYVPLVDDFGIDAVIRKSNGEFVELQIKASSMSVKFGAAALFAAITHEPRRNYFFLFYSERMNLMWLLSSEDFIKESTQNKNGKNFGKRSIWFNGKKTKNYSEHCKVQYEKYLISDFSLLKS